MDGLDPDAVLRALAKIHAHLAARWEAEVLETSIGQTFDQSEALHRDLMRLNIDAHDLAVAMGLCASASARGRKVAWGWS